MKTKHWVLLIAGGILCVLGIVKVSNRSHVQDRDSHAGDNDPNTTGPTNTVIVFKQAIEPAIATTNERPRWPEPPVSAEINIHVSYPDGRPAQGIKVQEVGLERGNIHSDPLGMTDHHGRISAPIELKPAMTPNDLKGSCTYAYRYVVMPENYRWEISDIYWSRYPDKETALYQNHMSNRQNWSIGKKVKISQDTKIEWEVVLRKSPDIELSFRDQNNDPIENSKVSVVLDLQAQSHTGFGGEISLFDANTDDQGNMTIQNPGDFFYSFELQQQRQYINPDLDYFSNTVVKRLGKGENIVRFHKCIGRQIEISVRDKLTGEPISGAYLVGTKKFVFGIQGGPFGPGFATDANGIYKSDSFCTDHLVECGVSKKGYKPLLTGIDNFIPGRVSEFLLEPESK